MHARQEGQVTWKEEDGIMVAGVKVPLRWDLDQQPFQKTKTGELTKVRNLRRLMTVKTDLCRRECGEIYFKIRTDICTR